MERGLKKPAPGKDVLYEDVHKYLVGMGGKPIRGRTKLQAMFFLLADDMPKLGGRLGHASDRCGPYSETIDRGSDYLRDAGMLSVEPGKISLTAGGRAAEKRLCGEIDGRILRILGEYKDLLNDLTDRELLAFIYAMFPKMAEQSAEYEGIRHDMEPLIMSLIKKEKISSQRGAELLGVTHTRVIGKMNQMGLRVLR